MKRGPALTITKLAVCLVAWGSIMGVAAEQQGGAGIHWMQSPIWSSPLYRANRLLQQLEHHVQPTAAVGQHQKVHSSAIMPRKLLQCWRCNSGYTRPEQRYWAYKSAAESSHNAIEAAVDSGAEMGVTNAAIAYSQQQFALATSGLGPYPGSTFYGGRRLR